MNERADAPALLVNGEGQVGIEAARRVLAGGGSPLDAVETGVRLVEADEHVHSVGRGGGPNLLGEVRCDAAIMNGTTLEAGAVGSLRGFLYPISIARQVMSRLPHVFLVADGAERFAREIGAEEATLLTTEARAAYEEWRAANVPANERDRFPDVPLVPHAWASSRTFAPKSWPNPDPPRGTAVYLARDGAGHLAAGTSTSGWRYGYPGRIGDSPIIGAGLYADNRYGACACTHTGEMTIRAATSRSVVLYLKLGMSVAEACREAVADLGRLQGGFLGLVVVYAMDRDGRVAVATNLEAGQERDYFSWDGRTETLSSRPVLIDGSSQIPRTMKGPS